jgi:hypothetical protein
MISSRPKIILAVMVALVVILGVILFVHPVGGGRDTVLNPAPHAPDQSPR